MNSGGLTRRKWLLPLIFFQLYLTVTVVLFFWGPWPWEPSQPTVLFAYLVLAQFAIAFGYLKAWKRVNAIPASTFDTAESDRRAVAFIKLGAIVTFLLLVPTSLSRTGELLPGLLAGIADPGAVYNANFERLQAGNPYVIVEYLRMLLSPLLVGIVPLAVVYWSRLSGGLKLACLVAIAFHLSLYVATGTNKGIADFAISVPWLIFLGVSIGTLKLPVSNRTLGIAFALLFMAFLAFFGAGQTQREGGVGELGVFNTGFSIIEADRFDSVSVHMSEAQRVIYESLARYLGQGYYALSMTFELDHSTTWGFGHSMFLARNADELFGTTHFTAGSLPGLLEDETGWGMLALWHSIYPWLASDFGFTGALVVLAGFAYIFGLSWGRALAGAGHWPVIMVYLLFVLFYYVPANNQIFQTAETCAVFFLVLMGWALSGAAARIQPAAQSPDLPPEQEAGALR
ncbi:hypothetical protein [Caenimonas soli]|uniref:hypothetical protein n=1 Tax=Caenimonas soli TaxID=2735555 RepID=UPI001556663C|nr:hypothetical protein [Caenimonas soli]NPC55778.1 hypothetical protein [Caenimonas soli]